MTDYQIIPTDGTIAELKERAAAWIETKPFSDFEMEGILHYAGFRYRDVARLFVQFVEHMFDVAVQIDSSGHHCNDPKCTVSQYVAKIQELNDTGGFGAASVRHSFFAYVLVQGAADMNIIHELNAYVDQQKGLGGIEIQVFEL